MSTATLSSALPRPHAYTSEFSELLGRIKDGKLLDRTVGYYITLMVVLGIALLGTFTGMFFIGDSWAQLALAPVVAIIMTQFSFVTHEAAHRQVFASGRKNDMAARILANGVVGISYSWWMGKHTKHHANPNTIGKDPDVKSDVIIFQADKAKETTGIARAFVKRQGWLFFPILTLEGLNLHVQAFRKVFSRDPIKKPRVRNHPALGEENFWLPRHSFAADAPSYRRCLLGHPHGPFWGIHGASFCFQNSQGDAQIQPG